MSFYGCHFSFDGVPCEEYGLMIYDFGASGSENAVLSSDAKIVEDRISRRFSPLHYGTIVNKPLEFTLTFGADMTSIDSGTYLDRWDLDAIASWLTGHSEYKWLEIMQPDMETIRYKCFITGLKHVDLGKYPWGFSCNVICDSPFAYLQPATYSYTINGNSSFVFYNRSSYRGFYKPRIELVLRSGGTFSIQNNSDGGRTFLFSGLPTAVTDLAIDNENEIITCSAIANPYPYFNFNFFRLVRGNNELVVNGIGTLNILCEFPVSAGG